MKQVKLAIVGAICLIVLGITGIFVLSWKNNQTQSTQTKQTTTTTSQSVSTSSSEDRSQRPTEADLDSVKKEMITRIADSEEDMNLKEDKNSKKTNQIPDVTDGKVLRQSLFDFAAIQKGDFSSVAGTWQDGYGNIIVIDKKGKITDGVTLKTKGVQHGILAATYHTEEGFGSYIQMIPAGIDASVSITDGDTIYDASDVSQDRIWMGDAWSSLADPYIYYYRVVEGEVPTEATE